MILAGEIISPAKIILFEKYYLLRMQKWPVFRLISKHSLNINFFCIFLWIINEFENTQSKKIVIQTSLKPF